MDITLDLSMPSTDYGRTDTAEDAVSSPELAADCLERAAAADRCSKWFVVAHHAGVQHVSALTLKAGNHLLVQTPGVMNALLATHDSGKDARHPHMDNFLKLYKKVQRAEKLRNTDCLTVESSPAPCVRRVAAPR